RAHHRVRTLEAGDLRSDEAAHLLGGVATVGLHLNHGLDRLAPLRIRDAVHADPTHALHPHDDRLDFSRIDVLPAGLDQLLLGLALDVVEVAVRVEAPHVAGVVPAVAEGISRHVRLGEVALEHERTADGDLAGRAHGNLAVIVIHQLQPAQGRRPAGGAWSLRRALETDESARLRLPEARPE